VIDITEVLQALHDSGIRAMVRWLSNGQIQWAIGDMTNGWTLGGTAPTVREAIVDLAQNACAQFPESRFAGGWPERCSPHNDALAKGGAVATNISGVPQSRRDEGDWEPVSAAAARAMKTSGRHRASITYALARVRATKR
jgi:hypothetical protein